MPISPHDPMPAPKVLLLGGTEDASVLAARLREAFPYELVTSLAGRPETGDLPDGEIRIGGFGGAAGLMDYLQRQNIRLIINATHPYAAQMSGHALTASQETAVPLLRLMRPAWLRDPMDIWIEVPSVAAAADVCRWHGKKVLLSLEAADIELFRNNSRCHFILRSGSMPAAPLPLSRYEVVPSQEPSSWLDERRLMMQNEIDLIISRNTGGLASYAKIDVARDLAIPVVMIERPVIARQPGCPIVDSVDHALRWISTWYQTERSRRTGDSKATSAESE